MARVGPHEGRRAGAAVQVLVAAAHGEIGAAPFRSTGTAPASAPGPRARQRAGGMGRAVTAAMSCMRPVR
jgi:hypothetical protein